MTQPQWVGFPQIKDTVKFVPMRVFSNRFLKAIYDKKLVVTMPTRLRKRLLLSMEASNSSFGISRDRGSNWISNTSTIEETLRDLRIEYGEDPLKVRTRESGITSDAHSLREFLEDCYPSRVLDAVEMYWFHTGDDHDREAFTVAVNNMFEDDNCPWRLDEGEFFRVDETFMGLRLAETAEQTLLAKKFRGSHHEFKEARRDLLAGDTKGCISNAHKAFESALKTVLNVDSGNASQLIRQLTSSTKLDDLPAEFRVGFGEQVLMSLATIGNRLGRHGQGETVVEVPPKYARLALELSAALLTFCCELAPTIPAPEITIPPFEVDDDDIPF